MLFLNLAQDINNCLHIIQLLFLFRSCLFQILLLLLQAQRCLPRVIQIFINLLNINLSQIDLVAFAEKESDSTFPRSTSESGIAQMNRLGVTRKTERRNKLYRKELALAFILLTASVRSLLSAQGMHFYFLLFQGISFLLVGLDLIGEQVNTTSS